MTRFLHAGSVSRPFALAALCAVVLVHAAFGQSDPWNYREPGLTRPQIEQVLARYQAAVSSPVYSEELRAQAREDADSIRTRLRTGDFRAGDRLRLRVEGQAALSDTFTVTAGPALQLPVVGTIPLSGVLRSEIEDRLTQSVDSVYRGAAVHVELLTRLAVLGGVLRPGFYALPPEALVDDAIGAAGGLTGEGRLVEAYVERGRDRIWKADSLQLAMRERRTIADLRLEPGDRIVVPVVAARDPESTVRTVSYLLSLPLTLYALVRLL